jgi:hypothetical protein
MSAYTSKKLAFHNAEQFKEAFSEPEPSTLGYVFIGNHLEWDNDDAPPIPKDTVSQEKSVWDNMFAAKKITGNEVELVVEKNLWTNNTKYRQYDDLIELEDLLTANTEQNLKPIYVMNSENNVYLCICNNVSTLSTIEPTGKNLTSNGNIQTSDGYFWKYLYNVKPSNRFLTNNWMPVPTSTSKLDFDTSPVIAVDGELLKIVMTNRGSGYIHSNVTVLPFETGCTVLSITSTTDNVSPNIASAIASIQNMSITGPGIPGLTHISSIDDVNLTITLSNATTANGGGTNSGNELNVQTRVVIDGDGTSAVASPRLLGNTIDKIVVTSYGRNYSSANVIIYGTGTGASARVVLPPKFGHGFNSAKQLGASNVMITMRIGEIDSSEGGLISVDTTFRQYGLLRDPYKYGSTTPSVNPSSNTVISQTTNITLISGPTYNLNEFVYQGTSPELSTFSGFVNDYTDNQVRLTRVLGKPQVGAPLKGLNTNPAGRTVVSIINPELQPFTGDILFVDNITKTQRTDGQAENLKFVIRF